MNTAAITYSILKTCLQKGLSFAAYTLPGEKLFHLIVQKNKAQTLDELSELNNGFVIHPFSPDNKNHIILIKDDFLLRENDTNTVFKQFIQNIEVKQITSDESDSTEIDKEKYLQLFTEFKQALDQNEFEKLVLSRAKNIQVDDSFDIIDLFKKLNETYPASFNYILHTPQSGIWLGASPEILLSMNTESARTIALAGTQKSSIETDWDTKEIEEQKFVVDYIKDILYKHMPDTKITISDKTTKAGNMLHLRTDFSFPSKSIKNLPAFLKDLHPTPAVCGLPKEEAKQFIIQHEPHDRRYYSGFLGPVNLQQETHLFVNLRCLQMNKNTLSLFVGGGLIRDSKAEKEWEETELKSTTLMSLL